MKRFYMCVIALAMGAFLIVNVGCDTITATVKGKMKQLENKLKDATVLERSMAQLAAAQKSRANLKEIANKFSTASGTALKQIKRLEEAKEEVIESFQKLQEVARNAGLPKQNDATAEDKAKSIKIGAKTFTGEEVYSTLKKQKDQVEKDNATIAREHKQSDFYKDRAEKIRLQMSRVDDNIAEMEQTIADFEMYQELLVANKTLEAIGLSDDKMNELLNTDSIMAELRKKVDIAESTIGEIDKGYRIKDLEEELERGSSFSITDDDLI